LTNWGVLAGGDEDGVAVVGRVDRSLYLVIVAPFAVGVLGTDDDGVAVTPVGPLSGRGGHGACDREGPDDETDEGEKPDDTARVARRPVAGLTRTLSRNARIGVLQPTRP